MCIRDRYINGEHRYVLNHGWAKQIVDLSAYVDSDVAFRFVLDASDFSKPDGVFIDDFRIVDYSSSGALPVAIINSDAIIEICEGESITLGHSSTSYDTVTWFSGDGSNSSDNDVSFTYNNPGTYTISLEASNADGANTATCLLYTSPSPRDATLSRMPSSA